MTYDRNYVSNDLLRQKGIKVIEISGSELVRGRGGPRCMSQPLFREDINVINYRSEGENNNKKFKNRMI